MFCGFDRLDDTLNLSISEQVKCDVPIAVSVSGGLDSSLIAAICYSKGIDFHAFHTNIVPMILIGIMFNCSRHFPTRKTIVPGPVSASQFKIFWSDLINQFRTQQFSILKLSAISKNTR